jgi:hypothetical protein
VIAITDGLYRCWMLANCQPFHTSVSFSKVGANERNKNAVNRTSRHCPHCEPYVQCYTDSEHIVAKIAIQGWLICCANRFIEQQQGTSIVLRLDYFPTSSFAWRVVSWPLAVPAAFRHASSAAPEPVHPSQL